MNKSVYDFRVRDIRGNEKSLADYKGQVLLIVNVASKCGLTPQYAGLESLYSDLKEKGLVVLGFPANNFGAQEPGTDAEIEQFCQTKFSVNFPMFSKISVKGESIAPLYQYLTKEAPLHSDVSWNFQKFLIDRSGQVVANIDPKKTPEEIRPMIEKYLSEKANK